tara:strand:+ start:52 stop:903 length:852 start_codon:yes stop_codon:yes gene_type:complete
MKIIEQNTSDHDLIAVIKKAVKHKQPISVIRCGDGEMHILKDVNDFSVEQQKLTHHHSLCLIQWRENIWKCKTHAPVNPDALKPNTCTCYLKSPNSQQWRNLARYLISYSIKEADYVGLTVPGRITHYYSITDTILQRYNINSHKLKTVSSLFPREEIFGGLENFKKIIQGNNIHLVTPNVERFKAGKIEDLLGVNVTYTDISGQESWHSDVRQKIQKDLSITEAPIILFGGGYGVKTIIPWAAKELGKIAIDVGSVLDAWSGFQSRHMFMEEKFDYLNWIKN